MHGIPWGVFDPEFLFQKFVLIYDRDPGSPYLEEIEQILNRANYQVGLRYIPMDEENPDNSECLEELYLIDPEGNEVRSRLFELPQVQEVNSNPLIENFSKLLGELKVVW